MPVTICKEPSGEEYTEGMWPAAPCYLGDESAAFEIAKLFMTRCYKVLSKISTNSDKSEIVTTIIDTLAKPSLIWEDGIPTAWLTSLQPIRANMIAASETTFSAESVLKPQVGANRHFTIAV